MCRQHAPLRCLSYTTQTSAVHATHRKGHIAPDRDKIPIHQQIRLSPPCKNCTQKVGGTATHPPTHLPDEGYFTLPMLKQIITGKKQTDDARQINSRLNHTSHDLETSQKRNTPGGLCHQVAPHCLPDPTQGAGPHTNQPSPLLNRSTETNWDAAVGSIKLLQDIPSTKSQSHPS